MSKDPSMINHFESFGAITLSDALNMVNHMSNYQFLNTPSFSYGDVECM